MAGCILLAFIVVGLPQVGGLAGLKAPARAAGVELLPEDRQGRGGRAHRRGPGPDRRRVPRPRRTPVVVELVSRRGPRRRRLHRPADDVGQEREAQPAGDPLVHHRPLHHPALAVDPRGPLGPGHPAACREPGRPPGREPGPVRPGPGGLPGKGPSTQRRIPSAPSSRPSTKNTRTPSTPGSCTPS